MTGSVGLVVGGTGFKATGYMTFGGETAFRVGVKDNVVLLSVEPSKIEEQGLQFSAAVLNKVNLSRTKMHATKVVVLADMNRQEALMRIEAGLAGQPLLPEQPDAQDGTLVARFKPHVPAGVELYAIERTAHEILKVGAKFVTSKAGATTEHAVTDSTVDYLDGAVHRRTTANSTRVAIPCMGFEGSGVSLMAEYHYYGPKETTQPTFAGLLLSMKLETGGGMLGDNREHLLGKVRAIFGANIPSFPADASKKGYAVHVERALGPDELRWLASLTPTDIESIAQARGAEPATLSRLCDALRSAAPAPPAHPTEEAPPWLAAPTYTPNLELQAAALEQNTRNRRTATALCKLLGVDTVRLQVRGEAYEAPLLGVDELRKRYGRDGAERPIRHSDPIPQVVKRLEAIAKVQAQIDEGFEALAQNPIIGTLLPNELPIRRASLAAAMLESAKMAEMILPDGRPLTAAERLCLVRDEDVFDALSLDEQADALHLLMAAGREVPELYQDKVDKLENKVGKLATKLQQALQKLPALDMPQNLFEARRDLLESALQDLGNPGPKIAAASAQLNFAQGRVGRLSDGWEPRPDARPDLLKLGAFETHIVIQDAAVRDELPNIREALTTLLTELPKYDTSGVEVSLLSDVLCGRGPRIFHDASQVDALMNELSANLASEGDAKFGNAVEVLVRDYVRHAAPLGGDAKGLAAFLITTGDIPDAEFLVDALKRPAARLQDGGDRVCVGLVRVGLDKKGRNTAHSLDAHGEVGHMIETSHGEDKSGYGYVPLGESPGGKIKERRVDSLFRGLVDKHFDGANDVNKLMRGAKQVAQFFRGSARRS